MTAIAGTVAGFRSMADGTLQLRINLNEQESKQAMTLLCDVGAEIAIARIEQHQSPDVKQAEQDQSVDGKAPYGEQARTLYLSDFFRNPLVWKAVGTDEEFLSWLRGQPCAFCKADPPNEAAHVRRIANGAGVGIKPEFSAISLCRRHHQKQHDQGESVFIGGKNWFDAERIRQLREWAWGQLKAHMGFAHWNEIPPWRLQAWAGEKGLGHLLPSGYIE